jgi:hippurate hydrolase
MKIEPKIAAAAAELTAIRRDIHAHPELGFEEERTSRIVAEKLKEWGCEVTTGIGKTGVVGTIRVGNNPARSGCAPTWTRCRWTSTTPSTIAAAQGPHACLRP